MKTAKMFVTVALLLFVAAAAVYLVVDASRQNPATGQAARGAAGVVPEGGGAAAAAVEETSVTAVGAVTEAEPAQKVVAYYFHGAKRCKTCRRIESYTAEAIQGAYAEQIKAGRLEWKVVNMEAEGNEHFVDDYQLAMSSVVLSDVRDGKQQRWKNLDRIWHLTMNKSEFMAYIRDETAAYLEEEHG